MKKQWRLGSFCLLILIFAGASAHSSSDKLDATEKARHLLNRFAFGPRPHEIETLANQGQKGLEQWFESQMVPEHIDDSALENKLAQLPSVHMDSLELLDHYRDLKELAEMDNVDVTKFKEDADQKKEARQKYQDRLPARILEELQAQRLIRAVESRRQFEEVLFDFWWNHFNIDWQKGPLRWLTTAYEKEALRKHLFSSFGELVHATSHSPAMLIYLDNNVSRGPPAHPNPKNKNPPGLNENYAREVMELHTLGVDGGYKQKDVTELARLLTGWSVESPKDDPAFVFRDNWHDKGEKTFLGRVFTAGGGLEEGEEALRMLAQSPSTAKFISTKLARYFVSDRPPVSLVEHLTQVFLKTNGDLKSLYRALFTSPEFWARANFEAKVKRPLQFVASSIRILGGELDLKNPLSKTLADLGEEPYKCSPPTGYSDTAESWVNPGALVSRLDFSLKLAANRNDGVFIELPTSIKATEDSNLLVKNISLALIGRSLSDSSAKVVVHELSGESRTFADGELRPISLAKAVALIIGSPEFQRR